MRTISSSAGSYSYGETSWTTGDPAAPATGKKSNQELIWLANTVPLVRIFKYYGLPVGAQNKTIICPLKSHKGGKERTPSFHFYPETNSFYCHGCHVGGKSSHACEFVAAIENIARVKAAEKILTLFSENVDPDSIDLFGSDNFAECLEITMDFSHTVREFRQTHPDERSSKFIEGVCWVYDQHLHKHKHRTNDALRSLVDQLKEIVSSYTKYEIK